MRKQGSKLAAAGCRIPPCCQNRLPGSCRELSRARVAFPPTLLPSRQLQAPLMHRWAAHEDQMLHIPSLVAAPVEGLRSNTCNLHQGPHSSLLYTASRAQEYMKEQFKSL